jgi:hypothetical protein
MVAGKSFAYISKQGRVGVKAVAITTTQKMQGYLYLFLLHVADWPKTSQRLTAF